jgi:adenosylcobyric acid synthase
MAGDKTTTQVRARVPGGGPEMQAYEIHMGLTASRGPGTPAFEILECHGSPVQVTDGWVSPERRVWGTYLHGLFDSDEFRRSFISQVVQASQAAPAPYPTLSFGAFQETQLDRLADLMRRHLDIARIRAMMAP